MTSWAQLQAFLKAEAAKVGPAVNAIAKFFKPMVEAGLEEIGTAALNAVMVQAPLVASGQEKFQAAVADVVTTLGQTGKTVATSLAQTAVQQAYNTLSAQIHPPANAPVAPVNP